MICSSCTFPLASDSRFCSHCGIPVVYAATPVQPPYQTPFQPVARPSQFNRVARHLQVMGILWAVYAVTRIAAGIAGLMVLHGVFGMSGHSGDWDSGMNPLGSWLPALMPVLAAKTAITVAAAGVTAWALLTKQPWGRVLAIVVAIFSLIHPVMGTALGIYTLWVLAPAVCGVEYAAVTAEPRHA